MPAYHSPPVRNFKCREHSSKFMRMSHSAMAVSAILIVKEALMADRYDLPRIPVTDKPTIFNREAGGWGLLGSMIGSMIPFGSLIGAAVGIAYGGSKGMRRMERELVEGRAVKDPTYWNSGVWSGWLIGILLVMPVLLLSFVTGGLLIGVALAAPLIGAVIGSNIRYNSMKQDIGMAVALRNQEHNLAKEAALEHEMGRAPTVYKDSVSREEAAALEQKSSKPRNHLDEMLTHRTQLSELEAKR